MFILKLYEKADENYQSLLWQIKSLMERSEFLIIGQLGEWAIEL